MQDILSAPQSVHICLTVEYIEVMYTQPAEPASISLSRQFHPASTISDDWLILDWTGWLLFQHHWLQQELQPKITTLIAFQFLMENARISKVLSGEFTQSVLRH